MESKTQNINVLYVDDEINNLHAFISSFKNFFNIFIASTAGQAKVILKEKEIHVLITDHKMPGTPGTLLLEEAKLKYPAQTRIVLSALNEAETVFDTLNKCLIFGYHSKPWNEENLKKTIEEAHEFYLLNKTKEILYQQWLETENQLELMKQLNGNKAKPLH